jgi:hypothetical protein
MRRASGLSVLVLLVLVAGPARADLIGYNWWVQMPLYLTNVPGGPEVGFLGARIDDPLTFDTAAHQATTLHLLQPWSWCPPGTPGKTYNVRLTMEVFLVDFNLDTPQFAHLDFAATLRGTLTPTTSSLTLTFASAGPAWVQLGGYEWGIQLDKTVLHWPQPGWRMRSADLNATLVVHAPEPTPLFLAMFGAGLVVGKRWRRGWARDPADPVSLNRGASVPAAPNARP